MDITKPLHIAVDQDCVLHDLWVTYDAELNSYGAEAAGIPRGRDRRNTNWDLKAGRTPREREIIGEIFARPGFFGRFPPIRGAAEVIRDLRARGHHVTVATTPFATNPTCASDKLSTIERDYGQTLRRATTLTDDKTSLRADVILDDKPDITGHYPPAWAHLLYGDYPYNAHKPGPRYVRWTTADDLLDLIREL